MLRGQSRPSASSASGLLVKSLLRQRTPGKLILKNAGGREGWLLQPAKVISRARMPRLGVCTSLLKGILVQTQALHLVERYFPDRLQSFSGHEGWWGVLRSLFHMVEKEGWFEVDWDLLGYFDDMECCGGEEPDEGDPDAWPDSFYTLADCATWVPVRYFNFGEEHWLNEVAESYPLLALFKTLVGEVFDHFPLDGELYTPISDLEWLETRCQKVGMERGAPFEVLPFLIDFVQEMTGNPLLDGSTELWDDDFPPATYRWDNAADIDLLREMYADAKPRWNAIEKLMEYLDTEEVVGELMRDILYGGDDDNDDD